MKLIIRGASRFRHSDWSRFVSALLILFVCLILAKEVIAAPVQKLGFDHLALLSEHYSESEVIRALPNGSALGVLWRTFGTDLPKIERVLQSGKISVLRIHLLNGPGLRNNQLGPYESLWGLSLSEFRKLVRRRDPGILGIIAGEASSVCESIASRFPKVTVLCSPILEHNLSEEEFRIVFDVTSKAAPSTKIVDNPVSLTARQHPQALLELHGRPKINADIVSLDGEQPKAGESPESYLRDYPSTQVVFWWTSEMNCRTPGPFLDPRSRKACWP